MNRRKQRLASKRPTEATSGVGLGLLVYGFATQLDLPLFLAAVLAVLAAFGPLVVSQVVDAIDKRR